MKSSTLRSGLLVTALLASAGLLAAAENSCISCHEKLPGPGGESVRHWKTSVHFDNGISCNNCHGGDPKINDMGAMDPTKGFIGKPKKTAVPDFCGKCHSAVRDNYAKSAHAIALHAGLPKSPNCVTCHTSHQQKKVTLELINPKTCGSCHTYDRAARLKEAMSGMEFRITSVADRTHKVFLEGLDVDKETASLFDVRNRTHRLTHVLDVTQILGSLGALAPDLKSVDQRVKAKEKVVSDRKALGTGIMVLFLVGAAIAWRVHRNLDEAADSTLLPQKESGDSANPQADFSLPISGSSA